MRGGRVSARRTPVRRIRILVLLPIVYGVKVVDSILDEWRLVLRSPARDSRVGCLCLTDGVEREHEHNHMQGKRCILTGDLQETARVQLHRSAIIRSNP
ncbi:uncharacterized protein BDV14DRAFT_166896 [Aspergillus stella-maris]|uniref:uncharacterized protein n=1 Tax=Aspergillus stella-maris TaxID=1810926 RepID=UPI003CCD2B79